MSEEIMTYNQQLEKLAPISPRLQTALAIRDEIELIKKKSYDNFIRLSELLRSLYKDKYYEDLGFDNFKECLDSSGLDISISQAYRMIKLAEGVEKFEIPKEELKAIKPTYLLEVFSLEDGDEIKKLLNPPEKITVNEVKELVREKKGYDKSYFVQFKVTQDTRNMINDVHKKLREREGQTIGENQAIQELSDSQCLEYVYAEMWNSLV